MEGKQTRRRPRIRWIDQIRKYIEVRRWKWEEVQENRKSEIEMAGDFSVIVIPYVCKRLKNVDDMKITYFLWTAKLNAISQFEMYYMFEWFFLQKECVFLTDIFLPCPDNLLANLGESRELVKDLLNQIPTKFLNSHDTNSSLGAALQAAYKLMVRYRVW